MINSWKSMTIGKYMEIKAIEENNEYAEDEVILRETAVLNDMTYEELLELPLSQTQSLIGETAFLYEKPKPEKVKKVYVLNGTEYVATTDIEHITTSQYIDFQGLAKNINKMLPQFLAIFLIPKGHKYLDDYTLTEVANDVSNHLSVEEGLGLAGFFTKKYVKLTNYIIAVSKLRMWRLRMFGTKEEKEMAKKTLEMLDRTKELLDCSFG